MTAARRITSVESGGTSALMHGGVMARPLRCRVGMHRWQRARNEAGESYRHCERCGKDGDLTGGIWILGGG